MEAVTSDTPPERKNLFGWIGRTWQGLWLAASVAVLVFVSSTVTSIMTTLPLKHQISGVPGPNDMPVCARQFSAGIRSTRAEPECASLPGTASARPDHPASE